MEFQFDLSDTYRKERYIADGMTFPRTLSYILPPEHLSAVCRAHIADINPRLKEVCTLQDVSAGFVQSTLWKAPIVPLTDGEMEEVLMLHRDEYLEMLLHQDTARQKELRATLVAWQKHRDLPEAQRHPWCPTNPLLPQEEHWPIALEIRAALATMQDQAQRDQERKLFTEREQARVREQEKIQRELERAVWIEHYGSDFLRQTVARGYNCQRQYVQERAAVEYPHYYLDFSDSIGYRDRSCPSRAAFAEAEQVGGRVVWLTTPLPVDAADSPIYDEDGPNGWPHEAVVVSFLGHDLLKSFPDTGSN